MEIKYRRILLKLSGEALGGTAGTLDPTAVAAAARQIAALQRHGAQVGVVVGGGNIWRGRRSLSMERNRADHMGLLATAINALALEDALEKLAVPVAALSAVSMQRFMDDYSARAANRLLGEGKVVVFACGTGSPFFSTDTTAALRAAEVGADVLLLAKNVDAVYSADPKTDPNAQRYDKLTYQQVIEGNLQATDLTAITMCREQRIPILVFAMKDGDAILRAAAGEDVGTLIG